MSNEIPRITPQDLEKLRRLHLEGTKDRFAARDKFVDELGLKYDYNPRDYGVNMIDGTIVRIPENEK